MQTFEYVVKDETGLHARPAGLLAKEAKRFESEIIITKGDKSANATKLMALMGLCVKRGDTVTITISGNDEETAKEEMKRFFDKNL